MARPEGFEPPTLCLEGRRSFQTELRAHGPNFKATTLECQNELPRDSVRRLLRPKLTVELANKDLAFGQIATPSVRFSFCVIGIYYGPGSLLQITARWRGVPGHLISLTIEAGCDARFVDWRCGFHRLPRC